MTVNVYLQSVMGLPCCTEKGCEKWKYVWCKGSFGPFVCTLSEFLAGLVSKSSLPQIPQQLSDLQWKNVKAGNV